MDGDAGNNGRFGTTRPFYAAATAAGLSLGRRYLPAAGLSGLSLLATACSPLGILNGMAPKRLSAQNLAYGAGPRRTLDVYVPRAPPGT
jgi:hypothetical protein